MGEKHYPTKVEHGGLSKHLSVLAFVGFLVSFVSKSVVSVDQRLGNSMRDAGNIELEAVRGGLLIRRID